MFIPDSRISGAICSAGPCDGALESRLRAGCASGDGVREHPAGQLLRPTMTTRVPARVDSSIRVAGVGQPARGRPAPTSIPRGTVGTWRPTIVACIGARSPNLVSHVGTLAPANRDLLDTARRLPQANRGMKIPTAMSETHERQGRHDRRVDHRMCPDCSRTATRGNGAPRPVGGLNAVQGLLRDDGRRALSDFFESLFGGAGHRRSGGGYTHVRMKGEPAAAR